MENIFAKLFTLNHQQVLITKEWDEDENFKINQATETDNIKITMGISFNNEAQMNEAFNNYNEEKALKFIKKMNKII